MDSCSNNLDNTCPPGEAYNTCKCGNCSIQELAGDMIFTRKDLMSLEFIPNPEIDNESGIVIRQCSLCKDTVTWEMPQIPSGLQVG